MKVFLIAVVLAVATRLFLVNIDTTRNNVMLALFIGAIFVLPSLYSLVSNKVFIAGGIYTKQESPLMFYSLQAFSAYMGTVILLLPANLGFYSLV